jgi:hypothetical protein
LLDATADFSIGDWIAKTDVHGVGELERL